ncbi:MFS transporter [Burkholderia plantarii]|uniref:MFS transporter n=1 Tax=Burkholderia plantarii TaxID=41899 RepID=UPI0008708854|nr:MFS transporter [Burkholderia plantarii]
MDTPEPERHALRALASANFAVGAMSYGVVGALPALAGAWRISPGRAALLMSAFSIAFALGAPLLQMLAGHARRRALLLAGLATLIAATLAGAAANGFGWLLATRIVAGLGAAAVSPLANAIGAGITPVERRGKALAVVFVGVTLSSVIAAPLAAALAHAFGWRAVFVALAAIAAGSAAWIVTTVHDDSRGERMRPAALARLVMRPGTATGLAVIVLQTAAFFATYTLILPLVALRFGASVAQGGAALLVFGVTGIVGNLVAQRVSLRCSAERLLWIVMGTMVPVFVAIALLGVAGWSDAARQAMLLALLVVWALMQDLFYPSQLRRVVALEPDYRGMVIALNSSGIFLGISLGAALGGRVADQVGLAALAPVSALLTMAAFAALVVSQRFVVRARRGVPETADCGAAAGRG